MPFLQKLSSSALRNFVFGVEDSLVSTVGLVSGIAAADAGRREILVTGAVLIFVEAFSMGVGSLVSENAAKERSRKREVPLRDSLGDAIVMFVSYFVSGFVPLFPYIVLSPKVAFWPSVIASLVALFALGASGSSHKGRDAAYHGLQMMLIGGLAIAVGVIVGRFVSLVAS